MKLTRWIIALVLLLLPIAGRALWYYSGTYQRSEAVATPDYQALTVPQPAISTPIPTPFAPIGGDAPLVVFDMAHGNALLISEMDPLINALRASGANVVVDDGTGLYLPDQLKTADAYIVLLPTMTFDSYTIREIQRFVERGGRMVVAVDPTRSYGYYSTYSSSEIANLLLAPYGLAFNEDYAYNMIKNEANFRNLILEDFAESPLTVGLKKVVFYSAQSLAKSPWGLIRGDANTLSSLDDQGGALPLAAASMDGNVLALGDMTFMTIPYLQVADNQVLLSNLVSFLAGSGAERVHDLQDYPYLFDHDIIIIAGENFELDQDNFSLFSDLQALMSKDNHSVRFGEMAVPGQDAIYLSSLPPQNPEITALLAALGITYAEDSAGGEEVTVDPYLLEATPTPVEDYGWMESTPQVNYQVSVPGVGKLSSAEFGILIYQPGAIQNQLYILGTTEDTIIQLARRLIGDGLYGCVVLQNIAVCPVDSSVSTDGLDTVDDYIYDYNYDLPPTPSG
jgi:hypothetical protein